MEKNSVKKYVAHCTIKSIANDGLVLLHSDGVTTEVVSKNNCDDFSDLYIGQEVVCLLYRFSYATVIKGVIDKVKYENAVRDSQKLPKGWICEPKQFTITIHGIVNYKKNGDKIDTWIKEDSSDKLYHFDNFYSFGVYDFSRVVALITVTTYPNGHTETSAKIWNEYKYNNPDDYDFRNHTEFEQMFETDFDLENFYIEANGNTK